jgi:hypothetical protein
MLVGDWVGLQDERCFVVGSRVGFSLVARGNRSSTHATRSRNLPKHLVLSERRLSVRFYRTNRSAPHAYPVAPSTGTRLNAAAIMAL